MAPLVKSTSYVEATNDDNRNCGDRNEFRSKHSCNNGCPWFIIPWVDVGELLLLPTNKVITKSNQYFNPNISSWVDQTTDSYKETIRFSYETLIP